VEPTYLTSHEVARLLRVSASAVLSWIDKGWLTAHRTPGGHRRVERTVLVDFLRQKKMPIPQSLVGIHRLLVIDDEPAMLRTAERQLKQHAPEIAVMTADGAIDGLLKIGTFRPDAVLLDAYMPGMNGIEVCRRIRETTETAHIVIVAITAHPSVHLASAMVEAGAVACLGKPLDPKALLSALGLDRSRRLPA
jgi:excisionase family DNA binding protein